MGGICCELRAVVTWTNIWALDRLADTSSSLPHGALKATLAGHTVISPILQVGNGGSGKANGCSLTLADISMGLPPPFADGSRPPVRP